MVEKSITANGQYSEAVYVQRDGVLGFSISGTWSATIELQRLGEENSANYPLHSDDGWLTFLSKTANYNADSYHLAPGWYRIKSTAYASGTAVCRIW